MLLFWLVMVVVWNSVCMMVCLMLLVVVWNSGLRCDLWVMVMVGMVCVFLCGMV